MVRGLVLDATALITTSKQLRAVCGAGGTAKDGVIEVQGDCHFCTVDVVTLRKPAKTDWLIFAFLMRVKRHPELTQISFNAPSSINASNLLVLAFCNVPPITWAWATFSIREVCAGINLLSPRYCLWPSFRLLLLHRRAEARFEEIPPSNGLQG